jgi:Protein of unknown function (DUF1598)
MIIGQKFSPGAACVLALLLGSCFSVATVQAQNNNNNLGLLNTRVVGGVLVDSDGAVRSATKDDRAGMLRELRDQILEPSGKIAAKTEMRMISLAKLQAEIKKSITSGEPVSDEVRFLAGLQRIEYVFVYPERNDIVLAGPAEGWRVRDDASVVGVTSGRPVLQLEDLVTAFRTVDASRDNAISVSIDPTPAGEVRLRKFLSQLRTGPGFDPSQVENSMKEAFGNQVVTLTAVPNDSRMAQTMVAADYRMKCLAMAIEDSPVAGLPSYMEMIRDGGKASGTQPRWWIACDYDSILKSEDGLAWKLNGLGVKAMTAEQFVDAQGGRKTADRQNKLAQRWADQFTSKFDELSTQNVAFGDLRNVMDLNVIATVIAAHQLDVAAGLDLSLLNGKSKALETPSRPVAKTIPAHCSFVSGRAGWTVSASGGVEINPWRVVSEKTKSDESVSMVRQKAPQHDNWWWN